MKKHGERMELMGMLALLLLAMASDGGILGVVPLVLLALCSVCLILVGNLFTRPCPVRRKAPSALSSGGTHLSPVAGPVALRRVA